MYTVHLTIRKYVAQVRLHGDMQLIIIAVTIGVHSTPQLVCYAHQNPVTPHEGVHRHQNFVGVLCTPHFLECTAGSVHPGAYNAS